MIIFLVGTPLSGKSTLAKSLSSKFGFKHFSTGDYARQLNMKMEDSILKSDISLTLNKEIMKKVEQEIMSNDDLIIDGFPRSEVQIEYVKGLGLGVDHLVLFTYVNPVTTSERAAQRDREDDSKEIVISRFQASKRLYDKLKYSGLNIKFVLTYEIENENHKCEDNIVDYINNMKGVLDENQENDWQNN